MIILGFYPFYPRYHDANVCLLRDGEVLFAFEEERLLRSQHAYTGPGDPVRGIYGALAKYGIHPSEIDVWAGVGFTGDVKNAWEHFFRRTDLIKYAPRVNAVRVTHHSAHVAASVLTAPFDRCLYFSFDGGGDDGYAKIGVFTGNEFSDLHTSAGLHIANFYNFLTKIIGFKDFEEGKLMGLAAYGRPEEKLLAKFKQIIHIAPDGLGVVFDAGAIQREPELDYSKFSWDNFRQHKLAFPRYHIPAAPELDEMNRADVAATVQKLTEELTLDIVQNAIRRTGESRICLSGGLFQNVIVNKKIRELPEVEALHVPMAMGDGGLGLGAALFAYWSATGRRCAQRPLTPYLGPDFSDDAIESAAGVHGLKFRRHDDAAAAAAQQIAEGRVVGWFQGRGEFGPRALGNRSVLADPRRPEAKARVNQLLKKRDWFMPYAPSILEEHMGEYLIDAVPSPYMNQAFDVRPERRESIPAAVHADGTCRPQTVRRDWSPEYHRLISEFHKITGIPVVLNTSFNQHGEAMVATPKNAIEHLIRGAVDVLFIGPFEIEREFIARAKTPDVHIVPEEEQLLRLRLEPISRAVENGNLARARELLEKEPALPGETIADLLRKLEAAPDQVSEILRQPLPEWAAS